MLQLGPQASDLKAPYDGMPRRTSFAVTAVKLGLEEFVARDVALLAVESELSVSVNKSRRKLLKCETAATFTPPQKEEVTV
jgi:hypothetical protein